MILDTEFHGLARGEPVVSNDTDFQDVRGLSVVTY